MAMTTDFDKIFRPEGETSPAPRSVVTAMRRGAIFRCPACGMGHLYRGYLKVDDHCGSCGEALHHQRADDAPPYLTIFVLGHVMIPLILGVDMLYEWPMWLNIAVWFPLLIGLSLIVLPIMKGAMVGLQWALRMHGFGREAGDDVRDRSVPVLHPVLAASGTPLSA